MILQINTMESASCSFSVLIFEIQVSTIRCLWCWGLLQPV